MDWKQVLGKIAPTAATLLAGPFAGMAVSALGDALGISEPTQEKIAQAFQAGQLNGDQLVQVKLAEQQLALKLEELGVKREEIEAGDRSSARDMQVHTGSWVPAALALFVTLGFFGVIGLLLHDTSVKPSEPMLLMLGSLGTAWVSIIGFYFGSSQGARIGQQALIEKSAK